MSELSKTVKPRKPFKLSRSLPLIAVFLVAGYVVVRIFAAGPAAVFLVPNGTITGNASKVSNSSAIGGQMVVFGATPAPTATPTPTSTPTGACSGTAGTPGGADPWGGCWPGPNNTGVPAGTSLTNVSGDLTVSVDNSVVSGKNVSGCIDVEAVGVTIKNSKAKCMVTSNSTRARDPANAPLTIQDSEIDCHGVPGDTGTAIGDRNINVYRTNIHGCENGFDMDSNSIIQDSYIHDLYNSTNGDPHTDGLQSGVGSNLTITHDVFFGFDAGCQYPNDGSCNGTSAVNIFNAASGPAVHDTTVSKNLLAGGAYTLYCPRVTTTNFNVLNNRFSTVYSAHVGEYGPSSDCNNETLSGNVYNETGQPVTLD